MGLDPNKTTLNPDDVSAFQELENSIKTLDVTGIKNSLETLGGKVVDQAERLVKLEASNLQKSFEDMLTRIQALEKKANA